MISFQKPALLFVLLALSAQLASASASASIQELPERRSLRSTSTDIASGTRVADRKLTYACGSKTTNGSGRFLMHPCNNNNPTASQYYNKNSTSGQNAFMSVFMGLVASLATLAGLLFLVDREMFDKATKAANIPQCECKCRKPRIDEDDMNDIHDVNDQYVTHETAIHLQELLDEEEKPYRFLRSLIFWKNTKVYDESDKYKIQETTSMEKEINQKIETVWDRLHSLWLIITWRKTRHFDENPDKYSVPGMTASQEEIKYDSSYESAADSVPWV